MSVTLRSHASATAASGAGTPLSAASQVGDLAVLVCGAQLPNETRPSPVPDGWDGTYQGSLDGKRGGYVASLRVTDPAQTQGVTWWVPDKFWTARQNAALLVFSGVESVAVTQWQATPPAYTGETFVVAQTHGPSAVAFGEWNSTPAGTVFVPGTDTVSTEVSWSALRVVDAPAGSTVAPASSGMAPSYWAAFTLTAKAAEPAQVPGQASHIYVSPGGTGDGSAAAPLGTIKAALTAANTDYKTTGTPSTIHLNPGTYREADLVITFPVNLTGQHAVITGGEQFTDWTQDGARWVTPFNKVRFSDVTTTVKLPSNAGPGRFIEGVFVDGVELEQVFTVDEVTATTFYVDDPDPVVLNDPTDSSRGAPTKPHRGVSYVIGVDPTQHAVEVSQHARFISYAVPGTPAPVTWEGIEFDLCSPTQEWSYFDEEWGHLTGGGGIFLTDPVIMVDCKVRHVQAGAAVQVSEGADNSVFRDCDFYENGMNGPGVDVASNVTFTGCRFWDNNRRNFTLNGETMASTIADIKVTHQTGIRFENCTWDYGYDARDYATVDSFNGTGAYTSTTKAIRNAVWFDENSDDGVVVGCYFRNVPVGVLSEVSQRTLVTSNIFDNCFYGVMVSGASDVHIYHNTFKGCTTSIFVREDGRVNGFNGWDTATSTGILPVGYSRSLKPIPTWNTERTHVVGNLIAYKKDTGYATDDQDWAYKMLVRFTGSTNYDGTPSYANEMVEKIDGNAYVRAAASGRELATVYWNYGAGAGTDVYFKNSTDFTGNVNVASTVLGREEHSVDVTGVSGALDDAYRPAVAALTANSPLPITDEVAAATGTVAGALVPRGAIVNTLWASQESPIYVPSGQAVTLGDGKAGTLTVWDGAAESVPSRIAPMPHGARTVAELLAKPRFIVAHRGGSGSWPEHTQRAYTQSVAHGVDALEISCGRTSDGVWFGAHDKSLERIGGPSTPVSELTWAEIEATMAGTGYMPARLDWLLDTYAGSHVIVFDPKYELTRGSEYLAILEPYKDRVILKFSGDSMWLFKVWHDAGFATWGYGYASWKTGAPNAWSSMTTDASKDILSMEYGAPSDVWADLKATGKPLTSHIPDTAAQVEAGWAAGAVGSIVASVASYLPSSV